MQTQDSTTHPHGASSDTGMDAGDIAPPVQASLETMAALARLLERETELMTQRRFKEAGELAEEKARLTAKFQSTLATLRAQDTALLGPKESPVRRRMKRAGEELRNSLARHARLVTRLKTMNESLVETISREVQRQRGTVQRYSGSGRLGVAAGQPASISLDRNI